MKRLFTPEADAALGRAMQSAPVLAFDFDGTLAPIVPVPGDARVPTAVMRRLRRLTERWPVAIITGRTIDDVRQRLAFEPWRVIGSHGAESGDQPRMDEARSALDVARRHLQDASHALHRNGVGIEDKGASIALHYRLAADRPAAIQAIAQALSDLPAELAVFGGKMVANVVPAWAHDKGKALAALVNERGNPAAIFVGDDVNDESVFAREDEHWFTVRIGQDYPNSRAQYVMDSAAELPRLLDLMLGAPPQGPNAGALG